MNEKQFRQAIHRRLPKTIHRQSMTFGALSMNGTPDDYLDGSRRDLWIESKMLRAVPRSGIVVGDYTPLQLRWAQRRWRAGKNVVGFVGLPHKFVAIQRPNEWECGTHIQDIVTFDEAALWVIEFCGP